MRTLMQFRNFEGLDHLRDFVDDAVVQSLGRVESWRHFDAHVILSTVKGRSDAHRPIFECELLINRNGITRPIVIKKRNADFYQAVRASLKAAEKILRRSSKIRVSKRRHTEVQQSFFEAEIAS